LTSINQVGGSAIEASEIAGHSDLEMTNQYTFVAPERQNELTRRIQKRLADVTEPGVGAMQPTRENSLSCSGALAGVLDAHLG
jgi:hypothetical protein